MCLDLKKKPKPLSLVYEFCPQLPGRTLCLLLEKQPCFSRPHSSSPPHSQCSRSLVLLSDFLQLRLSLCPFWKPPLTSRDQRVLSACPSFLRDFPGLYLLQSICVTNWKSIKLVDLLDLKPRPVIY